MTTVLVVDDDKAVRESLAWALSDEFLVETVDKAEAALERIAANPPDVVLLDEFMGGMSGRDFLRQAQGLAAKPAVLMFSANMDVDLARDCMRLGACDCMAKPLLLEEVKRRLASLAGAAGQARAAHLEGQDPSLAERVASLAGQLLDEQGSPHDLGFLKSEFCRRLAEDLLRQHRGDFAGAAQALGLSRDELMAILGVH